MTMVDVAPVQRGHAPFTRACDAQGSVFATSVFILKTSLLPCIFRLNGAVCGHELVLPKADGSVTCQQPQCSHASDSTSLFDKNKP